MKIEKNEGGNENLKKWRGKNCNGVCVSGDGKGIMQIEKKWGEWCFWVYFIHNAATPDCDVKFLQF